MHFFCAGGTVRTGTWMNHSTLQPDAVAWHRNWSEYQFR